MHFGPTEIILVVVVVLILFGAKRIPELMKGFGTGIREFKAGLHDDQNANGSETKDKSDNNSAGKDNSRN